MHRREWKLLIEDILGAITTIQEYVKQMDFDNFKNDRKTIDAVVRNLEIIGEAACRGLINQTPSSYPTKRGG